MRLIDADALAIYLVDRFSPNGEHPIIDMLYAGLMRAIYKSPTIEAEPVRHGRWIRVDDTFAKWKCSECGAIEDHSGWPYCHCGAKMDKEEEAK